MAARSLLLCATAVLLQRGALAQLADDPCSQDKFSQLNAACDSDEHAGGLQVPDLCSAACAAAYIPVYANCYPILRGIAGSMGSAQGTVVMDQFDALSGACGATVGGEAAIGAGDILVDGAHYFFHDGRTLAKGTELASVDIPLDYDIGFTVTPAAEAVDGWGDIIHITATGDNCCEYGDRVPGVWFKPGTRALHIRDGSNEEGTGGCDPSEELPAGTPTTVRVEIRSASIVVLFNEVEKCRQDREADTRKTFAAARVFASDPWHAPANADISNFYIACDSDTKTPDLQPAAVGSEAATCLHDSAQQNPAAAAAATAALAAAADVRGALYFIHGSQPLAQNTELASVDLPLDYDIGFTITPAAEEVAGWSNLIHITATGGNCCEHGDRVPGVWFYGNTRRMHIRDGSGKDGNGGCDPEEELPADSPTAVRLEMRVTGTVVFFNDVEKCRGDPQTGKDAPTTHKAARVFASDPWHDPAIAAISNFYIVCDSDAAADGLQPPKRGRYFCLAKGQDPAGGGH